MRCRLLLVVALAGVLLLAVACKAGAPQRAIRVPCDELEKEKKISRTLEVQAGGSFTVSLCSNPTTGFSWEEAAIGDASVLGQTGRKTETPQSQALGAAGQEVWTFKALKPGKTTVSIAYSRPWQGGEKGVWTFDLSVTVK